MATIRPGADIVSFSAGVSRCMGRCWAGAVYLAALPCTLKTAIKGHVWLFSEFVLCLSVLVCACKGSIHVVLA